MTDLLLPPPLVLAADRWPTNGELVADIVKLGYLDLETETLDPTYEGGLWWSVVRPAQLVTLHRPSDGTDFRDLHQFPDGRFHQIAFDPPYSAQGAQDTSTMQQYNARYGRNTVKPSPEAVQDLCDDGLTEMWRLCAEGGIVLVKTNMYVWSSDLWLGTFWTIQHAVKLGFIVEEVMHMISDTASPQPKRAICRHCGAATQRRADHQTWTDLKRPSGTESAVCRRPHPFRLHEPDFSINTQDHANNNASTMLVLRKPHGGKRPVQYQRATPGATR